MFLPNNSIVITSFKNMLIASVNNDAILTTEGFSSFSNHDTNEDTVIISSHLLPSFCIGKSNKIVVGTYKKGKFTNTIKSVDKLTTQDHLFIPIINFLQQPTQNRTYYWLYAKFLMSGRVIKDKSNDGDIITIIPVKMSSKEEKKINAIENVYTLNGLIYIKNKEIVEKFKMYRTSLMKEIFSLKESDIKFFLRALLLESEEEFYVVRSKMLAFDIFSLMLSKTNQLAIIKEQTIYNGTGDKSSKKILIIPTQHEDYIKVDNKIYLKINSINKGRKVKGKKIEKNNEIVFCNMLLLM